MTIGIGELTRRTGLTQQAVRAWEARYGFPAPARTDGGRRLYSESDVDRVQRVLALKDSGVRLASAIARVRGEDADGQPLSVYAELRRQHPQLERRVLLRPSLIAISHAIEDEAMSRVAHPHVFGAFQREQFYRAAAGRWEEIARTAASCLVFADFGGSGSGRRVRGSARPVEVPLEPTAPLLREWAVVVVGSAFSVVLTAWEIPRQGHLPHARREFETIFSFDPAAVRTAAEVFLAAGRASGAVDPRLVRDLADAVAAEATSSAGVDALVTRAFDYLQRVSR